MYAKQEPLPLLSKASCLFEEANLCMQNIWEMGQEAVREHSTELYMIRCQPHSLLSLISVS